MTQPVLPLLSIIGQIFSLNSVYVLTGLVIWLFSLLSFRDRTNLRRVRTGLFWLILGTIFVLGSVLPHWLTGLSVLAMVAIDGTGGVSGGRHIESKDEQAGHAKRLRNRIFLPVLTIPIVTFICAITFL